MFQKQNKKSFQSYFLAAALMLVVAVAAGVSYFAQGSSFLASITNTPTPVMSHPRIWVTSDDLPKLKSWAVASNPMYTNGIKAFAEQMKADMDAGIVPAQDPGNSAYTGYPTEAYAQIFAFMSLIENNQTVRDDYGQRARTLLMHVINEAYKGQAQAPFRYASFATSDRSRWFGSAFPTTVDWAYPYLTTQDKAKIRTVFLRWIQESVNAYNQNPTRMRTEAGYATQIRIRRSMNNYQIAQMRQIGLMALAFDPADDANNELRSKLQVAENYLWAADQGIALHGQGGLSTEGFQYGPNNLGRYAQFMLALATSGTDNTATCDCRLLENNPQWVRTLPAYFHSMSSKKSGQSPQGTFYEVAWYGDGQHTEPSDAIALFGPLALYYERKGIHSDLVTDMKRLVRDMQTGGISQLYERATDINYPVNPIFYFLMFGPNDLQAMPGDPRLAYGLNYYAEGIGRIFSRTGWGQDSSWITYKLGWNNMDHQHGDGNMFEFYRNGEWLTKERSGYGVKIGSSDYKNTLALENSPTNRNNTDYNYWNWERGSQYYLSANGDGKVLGYSFGNDYTYVLGDATQLYNSSRVGSTDITHASRSIFWLKPDTLFVYDRATSATAGRYKRFWLNTPTLAAVNGNQAVAMTPKGQKLVITKLLPLNAPLVASVSETEAQMDNESEIADGYSMHFRLKIEAPGNPTNARFLNILQGADGNASAQTPSLVQSSSGTSFAGAILGNSVVLFPVDVPVQFNGVSYIVPANVTQHFITGLQANQPYGVSITAVAEGLQVNISTNGNTQMSDPGGVLVIHSNGTTVTPFQNNATGGQNAAPSSPAPAPIPSQTPAPSPNSSPSSTPSTPAPAPSTPVSSSLNVDLASLQVAGLTPAFNPAVTSYRIAVPSNTSTIPLTATLADPTARLYVSGNPRTSGVSSTASLWNNVITVTVNSSNWAAQKTYTINVLRSDVPVSNPTPLPTPEPAPAPTPVPTPVPSQPTVTNGISSITVQGFSLLPVFDSTITNYTLTIPASTQSLSVTAMLSDPTSKLYINNNPVTNGQTKSIALGSWINSIKISSISANWQEKVYTITLVKN